ncbi:MAG: nitroreductase family protein [Sulfitobacter sp.]|uniref:nitroreductase family protein n=2 Tax=Rhodopirellula bahusiensis TaxID=2014065 RepID=UPI0032971639
MVNRDPSPRQVRLDYEEASLCVATKQNLPVPEASSDRAFFDVVGSRRSCRSFGALTDEQLGSLFWYTAKTTRTLGSWQGRATPSAGGIHPVDVLIVDHCDEGVRLRMYDSMSHALSTVRIDNKPAAHSLFERLNGVVEIQNGAAIVFAAQFDKTRAVYENADNLVWRDAGALLYAFYAVCEGVGLNCCGIGITCSSEVAEALGSPLYEGVGGCVIGSKQAGET